MALPAQIDLIENTPSGNLFSCSSDFLLHCSPLALLIDDVSQFARREVAGDLVTAVQKLLKQDFRFHEPLGVGEDVGFPSLQEEFPPFKGIRIGALLLGGFDGVGDVREGSQVV